MLKCRSLIEICLAIPLVLVLGYLEVVQVKQLRAAGEMSDVRLRSERQPRGGHRCWEGRVDTDCFEVFVMTYKRETAAVAAANYYRFCPRVKAVKIVWSESPNPPVFQNGKGANIYIENHYPSQSLNSRFRAHANITTQAVFSVDDDVRVTCRDLEGAHDVWLRNRNKIVGYFPRVIQKQRDGWRYRGYPAVEAWRQYSIILSKAAFISKKLLTAYSSDGHRQTATRRLVEQEKNCEDIALQFVAAAETEETPLYYIPQDEVVDYGSWLFGLWMSGLSSRRAAGQHMLDRSKCVTELSKIWNRPTNTGSPLPVAIEVEGGRSWAPATGWEYISSDIWAPLILSMPPLLCAALVTTCIVVLYQTSCRTSLPPSSPARLILKTARCILVTFTIFIGYFLVGCCKEHVSAIRPFHPPCDYTAVNTTMQPLQVTDSVKLRVAVVTGVYAGVVDGVSLTLNRMVKHLLSIGHEVVVLSPDAPVDSGIPNYAGRMVRVNGLSGWLLGRTEYYYAVSLGNGARQEIASFKPDIVHIATPDGAGTEIQDWAHRRSVPTICSYHTRFNTYFSYYGYGVLESIYWRSVTPFFNKCSKVLPPTVAVANELKEHGITSDMELWERGVDTNVFTPARRCNNWRGFAEQDEVVILLVCRLVLEKNLKVFVDIINTLTEMGVRHRSVVVGEGQARGWMQKQLPHTRFLGRANEEMLAQAYASSDIFLYPSTTETWGNVVLEAMASGLPVVGANASGTATLVSHGVTGYLTDPQNLTSYVTYLQRLIDSPSHRSRLSRAARQTAEKFTWNAAFSKLLKIYTSTLLDSP
eukprot:TRINITY_DN12084_c0_g1_i1.p1 TRINITY_DN12084_c0_g1~~TRINITY_DN12084_c0_g1_i1.p1  ORF type:complete len:812 (+),score=182.93 TRINITY_DN12084_c0_g1_i1:56-2491(+)